MSISQNIHLTLYERVETKDLVETLKDFDTWFVFEGWPELEGTTPLCEHPALESIPGYLESMSLTWDCEDIMSEYPGITKDQAIRILNMVERTHDRAIGINWTVIECAIDEVLKEDEEG